MSKAYSGGAGIQLARAVDFDAAVVDLKMEDMDGIEVLRILGKMDPDLPVIILTGHGSQTAARQGVESGAFDYLTKPCEFEDLLKKICDACHSRRSSRKKE